MIMESENKNVLDEVNKGCAMGMDAIKDILPKVTNDKFSTVLNGEYDKYKKIHKRIEDIYTNYAPSYEEPTETSKMNKFMTEMMVNMKTMTDNSDSKLAELLLQGTNMGIIEGRKLLNNKSDLDEGVLNILKDFITMQEDSVETLKKYL